jgi:AcrR family transcriptional regulator
MAAKDYLETHDIEGLTLRHVAELSGVSPPTVYAHFPTMDALVAAFFQWVKPRVGLDRRPPPLAELSSFPRQLFPLYDAHGALLRNLMNRPSWDRQRISDRSVRHGAWIDAVAAELPQLTPVQRRRGAMAIAAFWTPTVWRWLIDTCGFTPAEAQDVAAWAVSALVEALKRARPGLDGRQSQARRRDRRSRS